MKRTNRLIPIVLAGVCGCGGLERDVAQENGYLFGLTAAEIEQVVLHYDSGADVGRTLEQMRAPFACSRFGDLCAVAGEQGALAILEDTWSRARALAPRAEIENQAGQRLGAARAAMAAIAAPAGEDGISRLAQASRPYPTGLACPFGSIADESSGTHRIAGEATISHLGVISVGRLSISHYFRFFGAWIKWPASKPLCLTHNNAKVWDGVTVHSSSSPDICVTGKDEVTRTLYWWRPAGQYFRISGCGDYNHSSIKDCACKGSYVGPYTGGPLLIAQPLPTL